MAPGVAAEPFVFVVVFHLLIYLLISLNLQNVNVNAATDQQGTITPASPEYVEFDTAEDAVEYYENKQRLMLKKEPAQQQQQPMVKNNNDNKKKTWSDYVDGNGEPLSQSAEQALYRRLLGSRYLKHVRPVRHHSQPIVVRVGMCVMMIEDLIERDQIMIMASCVKMSWVDEYLKWDPSLFDNVTWMAISSEKIWLPDIAIVNSPEPHSLTRKLTNVDLNFRGEVGYFPSGRLATRCNLVITYFPFDWQHCEVRFESWIYPTQYLEIHLYPGEEAVDLKEYYVNFQWTIKGYEIRPEVVDYDGKNFSSITFTYSLRRKPAFYFMYFIFPELLLALLQTLSHTLPVEHPGRMTMLTALFIGTTVTHSGIAQHIPKSSDTMSLLQVYMSIMSINLVAALLITFVMLYTVLRYPNVEPSFGQMMIAFFSIVWPSPPSANSHAAAERQKLQQYLLASMHAECCDKQKNSRRTSSSAVNNKTGQKNNNKLLQSSNTTPGINIRSGVARDLSDLYLNHVIGSASPAAASLSTGEISPPSLFADDINPTPCCEDAELHNKLAACNVLPIGSIPPGGGGLFVKRRPSQQATIANSYELLIRNPTEGYVVCRSYSNNLKATSSLNSGDSTTPAGADGMYLSTQRCLDDGRESQFLPSSRMMLAGGSPSGNLTSLFKREQTAPSIGDVERSMATTTPRNRRPTTLDVPTTLSAPNKISSKNQQQLKNSTADNRKQNNSKNERRKYGDSGDDHDYKRRWLVYCVALDKSIMYANIVWNCTIPVALFFVVPYLHEFMLSPDPVNYSPANKAA